MLSTTQTSLRWQRMRAVGTSRWWAACSQLEGQVKRSSIAVLPVGGILGHCAFPLCFKSPVLAFVKLSSLDEATACRLPLLRNQFLIEVISILVSPVLLSNFLFFLWKDFLQNAPWFFSLSQVSLSGLEYAFKNKQLFHFSSCGCKCYIVAYSLKVSYV